MELKAAVEGLSAFKEPCEVEIVTDSNYVKHGITEWIHNWKANGWRTGGKKPVSNQDLWHELDEHGIPAQNQMVLDQGSCLARRQQPLRRAGASGRARATRLRSGSFRRIIRLACSFGAPSWPLFLA